MSKGRFLQYGGQYAPETMMAALEELEQAYEKYSRDPELSLIHISGRTPVIHTPIHNVWKGTRGTETSKYPEEKKENSIPRVAARDVYKRQEREKAGKV